MKKQIRASFEFPPAIRGYLSLLLILFAGSGCAALIYEVAGDRFIGHLTRGASGRVHGRHVSGMHMETEILQGILKYYTFPEDLFVGSSQRIEEMKRALQRAKRGQ